MTTLLAPNNSEIEQELFSKTCRPESLTSSHLGTVITQEMPTPKSQNGRSPFSKSLFYDNLKSFVNLKQTVSELDYGTEQMKASTVFSKKNFVSSEKIFQKRGEVCLAIKNLGLSGVGLFPGNRCGDSEIAPFSGRERGGSGSDRTLAQEHIENGIVENCASEMVKMLLNEVFEEIQRIN